MKKKVRYDKVSTYLKLNIKTVILLSITGLLFDGLMCLVPILQGNVIDEFESQVSLKRIIIYTLLFLGFVLFVQVNRFFKRFFVRVFANRMVLQMRTVSFDNLLLEDIQEFSNTTKGDIMNKNLSDIKDSADGIRKVVTEIFDSIVLMLGYLITMAILDYKITLIVLIFIIISIVLAQFMKKIVYKTTSEYKKVFSKSKDVTLNSINNEVYYRGLGVNDNYYNKYVETMDELEKKSILAMTFKGSLEPLYGAVALIGLFFVIYMCGQNVINGATKIGGEVWSIGTFSAFLSTYMLVSNKASKVGKVFNAYQNAKVSWDRCKVYLEDKGEITYFDNLNGSDLKVSNLEFGFDEKFVLKNINFCANKGEIIGICGSVHSGKSTLGAALSGIYNYKGSIKLCDLEIKEHKNTVIPKFIHYAPAITEIFNESLKYNISFNNESDVSAVINDSLLVNDIDTFSNRENEYLSHSMVNLSGGQQKRLQIARSLYNHPKLIILDDPFNAIDIKMSVKIVDNLINNYKDSIIIIINNQKEVLEKLDRIIFLKNKEYLYGTYDELLNDKSFSNLIGGKK